MTTRFSARLQMLGLSDCQFLLGRSSHETEGLAFARGVSSYPGSPMQVPIGTAIDMMVLSIAQSHSADPSVMLPELPLLRNEALLYLAEDFASWSYQGTTEAKNEFLGLLYGERSVMRARIAPILGCYDNSTTRQILFHSASNIERLSNSTVGQSQVPTPPVFAINAHDLADQLRVQCGGGIFIVSSALAA